MLRKLFLKYLLLTLEFDEKVAVIIEKCLVKKVRIL